MNNINSELYSLGISIFNSIPNHGYGRKNADERKIKECIKLYYIDDLEDLKDIEKHMDENFYLGWEIAKYIMLQKMKERYEKE